MTLVFAATLVVLGFIGSFVSGLVGVGGALVMVPLLYYVPPLLGVGSLDIKQVAGVTMAQVVAAAVVGAIAHGRGAAIHRPLAVTGGIAMASGAFVGAIVSRYVSPDAILVVFAVMTSVALPLMFVRPPDQDLHHAAAQMPSSRAGAIVWPGLIGIASGLVGAGGAFLLVPVLIAVLRVPVRTAIGTSLAITSVSSAVGLLGKVLTAQVALWPALAVIAGSLGGAPVGAQVSRRVSVDALRVVLALIIAVVMVRVWADVLWR